MKRNSHCFKVGDLVRWTGDYPMPDSNLRKKEILTVSVVSQYGNIGFNDKMLWYPENFELVKNQIVTNILNDL